MNISESYYEELVLAHERLEFLLNSKHEIGSLSIALSSYDGYHTRLTKEEAIKQLNKLMGINNAMA